MVDPKLRVAGDAAVPADPPAAAAPCATPVARRTPADPTPLPEPNGDGGFDLDRPECFLNRELTWLNFNFRVLAEAEDPRTPLMERLKFVAIVSSNLDEFFMKRIGGLKQQVGAGLHALTVDGRTPQQQIEACSTGVRALEERKRRIYNELRRLLADAGVGIVRYEELTKPEREALRAHYLRNIYPLVTPQATDPAHPFPFISNLSLNLLVTLRYRDDDVASLARVKVPIGAGIPRFLRIGQDDRFVRMESVMAHNLDLLFPGMAVDAVEMFRVTRNANTERDEERAEDLLSMIESELRERKFAPVVRLEVAGSMEPHHRGMLAAELGLDERQDVYDVDGTMGMRDLMELYAEATLQERQAALYDPPHRPLDHPELTTSRNVFHVIRDAGSLLLHHPYDAFSSSVERVLKTAAVDPKVRAIKMALYRTSAESRVIQALVDAARNGKQVAVVLELKARFDEAANIGWANRLSEVGIHVTYGVVGLKTHCKLILVVRQDYNGLRRYAHVGTGNYHGGTARLYSDLGLLTCDDAIGQDLTELFNYLTTGYKPKRRYRKILRAPKNLKRALLDKIERECEHQRKTSDGLIRFKLNALEDADVTRALYRASRIGVRVELVVRDTCRLRPGIPGLSESVRVVSIVGRFLEHARIYHFRNGGADEYFIGSADCMQRNLEERVEVVAPVEAPALRKELDMILTQQLGDCRQAWEMRPDGSYVQRQPEATGETGSQDRCIDYYEKRFRDANRLRRRKPRGAASRRTRWY